VKNVSLREKFKFIFRQQRLHDIEAKRVEKEAAYAAMEAKKAAKEEAEAPEREVLDRIRVEEERLQQVSDLINRSHFFAEKFAKFLPKTLGKKINP
jgi:ABC-type polar amino acid transport system ATPase subunit